MSTTSAAVRALTPGIYAPVPTFFLPDNEDLDLETLKQHVVGIATAGVGILVCGTMGEAHHLSPEERVAVVKATREALDGAGFPSLPIIAGTGVGSTRETIARTKESADAGADCAIVIPSGYFAGVLGPDRKALKRFFGDVSEASTIPVMVYNYPGATGGINMDSDLIEEMALEFPNLCGVKLTCGEVGKLTRIAATVAEPSFDKQHSRKNPNAPYLVLGGLADTILSAYYVGGHGAITGLANLAPYALQKLWTLTVESFNDPTVLIHAQQLQCIIARADRTVAVASIAGTKWLLQKSKSYGGVTRLPLPPYPDDDGEKLWAHPHVVALMAVETVLEKGEKWPVPDPIEVASKAQAASPSTVPGSGESGNAASVEPTPKKGTSHSRGTSLSAGVRSFIGSIRRSAPQ